MTGHGFGASSASGYAARPLRQVPGYAGLLRMSRMLLAERVPEDGRVLVLGAGGGLELREFADAHAGWSFDGVDPSAEMLKLAEETVGEHASRVSLHEGTIELAPPGPFDGATCILTFHFIVREQRLETLRQIRQRLKPGAPFVLAHISFPQTEPERSNAIARHVLFGVADGTDPSTLESSRNAIGSRLTILSPEDEEAMLREAGFTGVEMFYAAFSFRGWVAYAG
jgi:tRNA (cmo5U34)-methyltransferase